ncbi:MAG: hypothetical protein NT178_15650 [Proteobacteria bacterium]|nr:hypothetical protein [Pseudomonadota bacterium]
MDKMKVYLKNMLNAISSPRIQVRLSILPDIIGRTAFCILRKLAKPGAVDSMNIVEIIPEPLKSFLNDCIGPYIHIIKMQGVLPVVQSLINLIEKHGSAPSVAMSNRDDESLDLISVRDNLATISLKDHTYSVTRNMLALVKEEYRNYENLIPKTIVVSLAHDLGKIPELRESRLYNTSEHTMISANKLDELFVGIDNVLWRKEAVEAVRDHHIQTDYRFINLLKTAERRAREMELITFSIGYEIKPFKAWFDVDEFLKMLEPDINTDKNRKNKHKAFSFRGIIYARPDYLYELAKNLCNDKKALDLTFVYELETENAIRLVANALMKAGHTHPSLQQNRYAQRFEIKFIYGRKLKDYFTPINMDGRFDIAEIESRKSGYLKAIEMIYPR